MNTAKLTVSANKRKPVAQACGGLTLVELLVVVLIIAALGAIAIPRIAQSADTARKRLCRTNIEIINCGIEEYSYDNSGSYPTTLEQVTGNPAYFPDGAPICPITQKPYSISADNYRVDTAQHNH